MESVKIFSKAKINLSLNITGFDEKTRLHYVDTVMQSIDLSDCVNISLRQDEKVNISFFDENEREIREIDKNNNTVLKTVEIIKERVSFGADIVVNKKIPLMAGLGGSSVNVASTLLAFDKLLNLSSKNINLIEIAKRIGSDVSFMLKGGCALIEGTGEIITPINNKLSLNMVLVRQKDSFCLTKEIYSEFDRINKDKKLIICDNKKLISFLEKGDNRAIELFSNALLDSAQNKNPSIKKLREELMNLDAINVILCGSGSMLASFFDTKEKAEKIERQMKEKGFYAKLCLI